MSSVSEADAFGRIYQEWRRAVLRVVVRDRNTGTITTGTAWPLIASSLLEGGRRRYMLSTAGHVVEGVLKESAKIQIFNCDNKVICDSDLHDCSVFVAREFDQGFIRMDADAEAAQCLGDPPPVLARPVDDAKAPPLQPMLLVGYEVCWIGYPSFASGYFDDLTPVFCVGRIAAIGRRDGTLEYLVDGNVNKGMSGGMAMSRNGNVIGGVTSVIGAIAKTSAEPPPRNFGVLCPTGVIALLVNGLKDEEFTFGHLGSDDPFP